MSFPDPSVVARSLSRAGICLLTMAASAILSTGCGLFEPRPAEDPAGTSGQYPPATEARIVITNLQHAVEQKSVQNYVQCFSDPFSGPRPYSFLPSSEGSAQYASVFRSWTTAEEQAYFQNLAARTSPTSASGLVLTERSFFSSGDSALAEYDYQLTFEHTDAAFPKSARGNLQFALARNSNTIWSIYRWSDFKTTADATWSLFKGKFSN